MNSQERRPKELLRIAKSRPDQVGDGFTIRRPMPGPAIQGINPFLLLDHAGPTPVEPSEVPRGVDEHPHRGFETVTVVLQGELEHRDSAGNSGHLREGDVQWMTAASGVVHEEKYGRDFTRRGGTVEMVQLWVNLPAKYKGEKPGYQDVRAEDIPLVELDGEGSKLRVIAGEFDGVKGGAKTFTPVMLFDVTLNPGADILLPINTNHTTGLYVLRGGVLLEGGEIVRESELAGFTVEGDAIRVKAEEPTRFLLIGGEPIDEPVVSYGPFVMNSMDEIRQAYADYREGKMGTLDIRIPDRNRSGVEA
ncbi:MAG: pirin family protein [Ignavibacteriae bacterium]|nr:pirin family protein [Ignavibacteriota bacterium]MCB9214634.1 pirin family protein [Ignavibacteria bacterium]